jgi:phosphoribosyl 1,2-cyclic phosphate phosphodiesterase
VNPVPFKITFLGTGTSSGVPMIGCNCTVCTSTDKKDYRLRSSILIESATTTVAVDATPDFRYQMLKNKVSKLDAILFTHPHKDHIGGIDDVRGFNYFSNREMPLYVNQLTRERILRDFDYAFEKIKYEGSPNLKLINITDRPFLIGDLLFTPIRVCHYKMQVLGYRIGNFTYITDANKIEPAEMEKINGTKVLVLNALRKTPHISHFTLQEAVDIANGLKVEKAFFTHISHQLGLHKTVNSELPDNLQLAYDGLILSL